MPIVYPTNSDPKPAASQSNLIKSEAESNKAQDPNVPTFTKDPIFEKEPATKTFTSSHPIEKANLPTAPTTQFTTTVAPQERNGTLGVSVNYSTNLYACTLPYIILITLLLIIL